MEAIRTIQDFKDFMNANYNNIYSNAIKAEELTLEDELLEVLEDAWLEEKNHL